MADAVSSFPAFADAVRGRLDEGCFTRDPAALLAELRVEALDAAALAFHRWEALQTVQAAPGHPSAAPASATRESRLGPPRRLGRCNDRPSRRTR
jgi:hypothetical protein